MPTAPDPDALTALLPALACPHCGGALTATPAGVACDDGHAFDRARQGYLALHAGVARAAGDTAAMVAARERVLAAGHLDGTLAALVAAATAAAGSAPAGPVLDVGAGTGAHLAAVLDALPARHGLAVDVAAPALRRAARAHPRALAVGGDAWQGLPVASGSMSLALVVLAPRPGAELARVLRPQGRLVVVTPEAAHLQELREPLGMLAIGEAKPAALDQALAPHLTRVEDGVHEEVRHLPRSDAVDLALSGPTGHHRAREELAAAAAALPDPVAVTLSLRLTTWRPTTDPPSPGPR